LGFVPKQGTAMAGVKEKMSYRAMLRRGRRGRRINRKVVFRLRNHRQKRFDNRRQAKIAPSICSNKLLELRVVSELCRLYRVSAIVVEKVRADVDLTSGRKGARSGKGFSPVMIGQAFLFEELAKLAPVIQREGWQKDGNGTSQIRKHLGLVKEKQDKAKQVPETHAVDAVALAASHFVRFKSFHTSNTHGHDWSGKVCITPAVFKVISKPRITRRRLHDAVPASCGVRERYGGSITPFEARKGDLIEYQTKTKGETKTVIGYCSGFTGKNLSLSDANWSRLGRFAHSKCRILDRNTGLVISGASTPAQLPPYSPYDQAFGYGRSTPEV
ncbi:MAG: RRXRR domain-containing protein, partial [Thermosynechococcaceae cyanobacterium]